MIRNAAAPLYIKALPLLRRRVPDAPEVGDLWSASTALLEELAMAAIAIGELNLSALLMTELPDEES